MLSEGDKFTSSNQGLHFLKQNFFLLHISVEHDIVTEEFVTVWTAHVIFV